jgi:hypothetical protein
VSKLSAFSPSMETAGTLAQHHDTRSPADGSSLAPSFTVAAPSAASSAALENGSSEPAKDESARGSGSPGVAGGCGSGALADWLRPQKGNIGAQRAGQAQRRAFGGLKQARFFFGIGGGRGDGRLLPRSPLAVASWGMLA